MRKVILLMLSFLFVLSFMNAYAHPPSDIKIEYDAETRIVSAVIVHPVSNIEQHFIKKVDVWLNGEEVIVHKISGQDNNHDQSTKYMIPDAKTGDTITIEAYCSMSGKLKKDIDL
ncbi:hypothetical protein ACFL60_00185 [Candidatus Omnitrophota bacterium]